MRLSDLGPLPLSIIASLVLALLLLALRIFVMQRVHSGASARTGRRLSG